MRRFGQILLALLIVVLVVAASGACYVRAQLRSSLPQLEGTATLEGLSAPVTVTRDALGVPTITGTSRQDVARALGFLHAQDRFFQMDLQRRQPAGELSALVGARAFELDAENRVHRFRHVAKEAYARTEPEWRVILDAYAAGVNAGLQALGSPPFEYLLLRATPEPWQPEDSLLTVLAMFISLQGRQAVFEQTNQQLRDALPEALFRFLTAVGSEWDAPVEGTAMPRPSVPGAEVADLRTRAGALAQVASAGGASVACVERRNCGASAVRRDSAADQEALASTSGRWLVDQHWLRNSARAGSGARNRSANADRQASLADEAAIIGSNNWAVDAAHSASAHALVANDMHLNLSVPNIWYRASMAFPDPGDPLKTLRLTGVTLPGLAVAVVGSNGYVAWGFTNTGGDWSDLVRIEPDPRDPSRYLTPDGPRLFDIGEEAVPIKGEALRQVTVRGTIWGPIVWKDAAGHEYAQRWLAHDPTLIAQDFARPERTRTVDEMMAAFAGLGLPNQNVTMADVEGRVAWTIGGAIPRRRGLDGFTPESWADGSRGWDGYLEPADVPRIVQPEGGRIWTANAPVVDGARLAAIGDGGYADGIRARIIRDRLMNEPRVTPKQLFDLQLDDTALFLERWRGVVLDVLDTPDARSPADRHPSRAEFRRLVASTWSGRASPDSVAYRLVRTFRQHVVRRVLAFVTAPASARDPSFDFTRSLRTEGPVWALVAERPVHLLDPQFNAWNELLIAAVDTAIVELTEGGRTLEGRTWGEFNRALIQHPLGAAVPLVHRWLNMPEDPLPGDVYTPRAHSPRAGPSERMVVSPGHEEDGILQMPTGQSAHPLSPYFGTMQRAWVEGSVVPFLPGRAEHTLTLSP